MNTNDDLRIGSPRMAGDLIAERNKLKEQLAAEREVGHNQAVTLGQHIARLEDQLTAAVEALKGVRDNSGGVAFEIAKAALEKIGGK